MKIGVYFHLSRIGVPLGNRRYRVQPTGVGTHAVHMIRGLGEIPGVELTAIAPSADLDAQGKIPSNFPMAKLPVAALPYSRVTLETAWSMFNRPSVDRWAPGCDWIYCPQEAIVATRTAKLAVTVHDTYYLEPDYPWESQWKRAKDRFRWKLLFGAIRKHTRLVLAVSEFTKSRLVELLRFDPRQIMVIGNPIDDLYFDEPLAAEDDAPLPAGPYVLVVGGLARKKGGDYLLETAQALESARPDLRIVVCGVSDGEYARRAAQMRNMVCLGYEPAQRYLRLLKRARALLMLSRYEGFGVPAIEAMAAGTPAVVSRRTSLPEAVGDGGMVVEPERPDEVVQMINDVDRDAAFREQLIARGRKRAEQFRRAAVVRRVYEALRGA